MNVLLKTLSGYQRCYLRQDLLSGVVIAAVSIPISMGYAQIAGLPAAYGLYGSVLPVLLFALFSTSPQFIFGVDAAPAAMVGSMVAGLGIPLGSEGAIAMVPLLAFYTGVWLLLFALLKAGKCSISSQPPSWAALSAAFAAPSSSCRCPSSWGTPPGRGNYWSWWSTSSSPVSPSTGCPWGWGWLHWQFCCWRNVFCPSSPWPSSSWWPVPPPPLGLTWRTRCPLSVSGGTGAAGTASAGLLPADAG